MTRLLTLSSSAKLCFNSFKSDFKSVSDFANWVSKSVRRDPNWATLFCTLDTSSGNVFKKGAASNACKRVATDEFSSLNCKKYYKWFEGKGSLFMSIIVTDCNCSSKLMKYYSLTWLNMASNWLTRTVMFFLICVWFEDKIDNWLRNWWLLSLIILRSSTTETRKKWINE